MTIACNCSLIVLQYPAYDSFVESVREEAEQAVKRLRHHPSVVIFGWSSSHFYLPLLILDT